jgi:hypothetical protein
VELNQTGRKFVFNPTPPKVLLGLRGLPSLVLRIPTDCGALLCVIKKRRERGGHSPHWAAEPEIIIIIIISLLQIL